MVDLKQRAEEVREAQEEKAFEMAISPISITRYRNAQNFMRLPLFSTKYARNGRQMAPIQYTSQDGSVAMEVTANSKYGLPDQVDGNILRYAVSKAREIKMKTGVVPPGIEETRYKLLRVLGMDDCAKSYQWLEGALDRLSSAHYKGNFFSKDILFTGALLSFSYSYDDEGEIEKVAIAFNPVVRAYLQNDKSVLAIDGEILLSRSPLRIRLMELVQVHIGDSSEWSVKLDHLRGLCYSQRSLKHFKVDLKGTDLSRYTLSFSKARDGKQLVTFQKVSDD
jgi:hypothetical protein